MEFDRTRKAIGSDQIAEEDRKKLFNTFTSAGGKVVDEKAKRRMEEEARRREEARGGGTAASSIKLPSEIKKEQRQRELERQALDRRRKELLLEEASGFFARWMIRIRCYMAGLTPLNRGVVLPSALSFFSLELRRALIECNIIGNELLVNEPEVARLLRKELRNPLMIELINRTRQLYDRAELSELLAAYSESNPRPVPIESMRVPLLSLLRKLYALMPYREAYLRAAFTGILVQQRVQKKREDLYQAKRQAIDSSWRILMERAFPKILMLVQRLEMKNIAPGHLLFEEWIGFGPDLVVRSRPGETAEGESAVAASSEGEDQTTIASEGSEKEGEGAAPGTESKKEEMARKLMEFGMSLHRLKSPDELRRAYDERGEYARADIRDKAFIAYLLLNLFDDQLAFILTTNRLQLESTMQDGVRLNLKQDMTDTYQTIRNCYDIFRAYYHDYLEYRKVVDDASRPGKYVESAKKISMFESRRGRTGREVRVAIRNYMSKVEKLLAVLLKDLKEGGRIVKNPDDAFVMELEADRVKVMNGKKIKTILRDAYAFAYVLARRLENGDLFGGVLELSDEDFVKAFGVLPSGQSTAMKPEVEERPVDFMDSFSDEETGNRPQSDSNAEGDDFIYHP